jgi:hypothetical protein
MEHMGNYVIDRETGRKIFESMPLCELAVRFMPPADRGRCEGRYAFALRLWGMFDMLRNGSTDITSRLI